jgi:ferredoxin
MRVRVLADRCQGHGRCFGLAPDVFDSDDLGNAVVIGDGTVPAGLEADARLAADNCPEFAIEVDEG